ncbi:hypothetical protein BRYFOR_08888 [Marvinbryantia formatexigens DSM 14469]|uniref:Uncharacterized protein n=1 Tax=Marvinbryantia formatexigens DSM 14469 TaxID=478749 RepID=C6LJQ1_9FIRM|nr:hypothetical protein BRYFOR_08888 [Marvinbryantia formatexigens DSM 14469]
MQYTPTGYIIPIYRSGVYEMRKIIKRITGAPHMRLKRYAGVYTKEGGRIWKS